MGKKIEVTEENVYHKSSTNFYTYMKTFGQYTGTLEIDVLLYHIEYCGM